VRRGRVFSSDADYVGFMAEACKEHEVAIWAWCLMPNHVHLLAVPEREESLAKAVGRAHWRYTRMVNFRTKSRGYLFQGRFFSCVLDGDHAVACARYIEMNPVRVKLAPRAADWRHSSARFHLGRKPDGLTTRGALDEEIGDWPTFLRDAEVDAGALRRHTR
jgi:putative transposase